MNGPERVMLGANKWKCKQGGETMNILEYGEYAWVRWPDAHMRHARPPVDPPAVYCMARSSLL